VEESMTIIKVVIGCFCFIALVIVGSILRSSPTTMEVPTCWQIHASGWKDNQPWLILEPQSEEAEGCKEKEWELRKVPLKRKQNGASA
jgi:hypothetical protein